VFVFFVQLYMLVLFSHFGYNEINIHTILEKLSRRRELGNGRMFPSQPTGWRRGASGERRKLS